MNGTSAQPAATAWRRRSTRLRISLDRFSAHEDLVTTPGGDDGMYQWVQTPDTVRMAAVTDDGDLYVVRQHHYLPDTILWQLPGGAIDPGEHARDAAARELAEETGVTVDQWHRVGTVWPLPGMTPARVHLWTAADLSRGPARPESSEADLLAHRVPIPIAVAAVHHGHLACAASAQLVLTVADHHRGGGNHG